MEDNKNCKQDSSSLFEIIGQGGDSELNAKRAAAEREQKIGGKFALDSIFRRMEQRTENLVRIQQDR